ncbi:hypothetical protein COCHEDRAFT_1191784 [Bipolaris maydis C5]|uniref:Apurinic-apyrimidinic endonuclease 1 n=1 Tax=Cochliobolus heterostrophus (strain C5 / ATCC 48332 / race O) TaxID=701091 RepID=M2U8W6_COCH5|nr:hypothetical protein COCHEDRAFT_1191784 [Bipolaris maydis C5]KAJ6214813.1 DNA-lyase [Bipolaris maydis]
MAKPLEAQYTEVEEVVTVASNSPRTSKRATKRVKYEQETDDEMGDQQSDNGEGKPKKASKRTKKVAAQEPDADAKSSTEPKHSTLKKAAVEANPNEDDTVEENKVTKKTAKSTKKKAEDVDEDKPKKVTKSKAKPAKILPPIAERTKDIKLRVGAHVSIAGGVHNAVINVVHIGTDVASGNAFAMFMKNQRKWETVDMDPEHAQFFVQWCKDHSIDAAECCLPHGSYLVNLAHPDPARKKQAYDSFLNDLTRCHRLGIRYYNFHPGNANATTHEEGIRIIAENLNKAHADPETGKVVTVLETMATLGNTIGGTFSDLAAIIKLVDDKSRVGVCLDTCHVFAAGYDLRTPEAYAETMKKFDEEIGLDYLKAFHINDSKAPLSSHRDLHARIGTGYLGLESFHNLMNDERFHGLPMVLETPIDVTDKNGKKVEDKGVWAREIKMLESLVGMDIDSEEFKTLSARLQDEGAGERERVGDQVQRKTAKDAKPKSKRAAKKKVESEEEDDMEE